MKYKYFAHADKMKYTEKQDMMEEKIINELHNKVGKTANIIWNNLHF